jgi:hypothetical protein
LDMALLFESSFNHTHKIFKYVVKNWLYHESFYPINGVAYYQDDEKMQEVALEFCRASIGVINWCIGALDGWVVNIRKPLCCNEWRTLNHSTAGKGFFN